MFFLSLKNKRKKKREIKISFDLNGNHVPLLFPGVKRRAHAWHGRVRQQLGPLPAVIARGQNPPWIVTVPSFPPCFQWELVRSLHLQKHACLSIFIFLIINSSIPWIVKIETHKFNYGIHQFYIHTTFLDRSNPLKFKSNHEL